MTALLARAPRAATRQHGEALEEVPLEAVVPGDRLIVRQGEIVPVDGIVASRIAVLDKSALTGEPLPVERRCEQAVLSGSTNVGVAFYMSATRLAADSTYAGIIRLVAAAQLSKAPMARLADRFAVGFLAFTLALADRRGCGPPIRSARWPCSSWPRHVR